MAARSCPRNIDIPLFLAPAFAEARAPQIFRRQLATSSVRCQQHNSRSKEKNKKRGVSAIRSTGPRVALNVNRYPLPMPAENAAEARKQFKTNENHGLWGFFTVDKRAMLSPEEESAFGRDWTYQELSMKDWEDLHKLHWTCVMEQNRIRTRLHEMKRLKAGYGATEAGDRLNCVSRTLRNIRFVLQHRHLNHHEARNMLDDHADVEELLADSVEDIEDDENWANSEPESPMEQISYPPVEDMQQPPRQPAPR